MLLPYFSDDKIEAGLDEAGRGCLAGPVVAAAVILPRNYKNELLNDSKKLKEKERDLLRDQIMEDAIAYAVAEVDNHEIDKINILKASFLAMHRAIDQLNQVPELLLVDGNRFTPYQGIAHECIIKGDGKYLSIAAASILAKTHRDAVMRKLSEQHPEYDWENNMGYPTPKHRKAIKIHGPNGYHRMSFTLLPSQLELF